MEIAFSRPMLLLFFFSFPFIIFFHFYVFKSLKQRAFRFANFEAIKRVSGSGFITNKHRAFVSKNIPLLLLRLSALGMLILGISGITILTKGSAVNDNIVIALDTSSSMLADDFTPNRFEASKASIIDYLNNLSSQVRIGVVSFSGVSIVESELSDDKKKVMGLIQNLSVSEVAGTDLSQAIITSVNLFPKPCCEGDAIILITDGRSTVGGSVFVGINYAKKKDVKVYTMGIATKTGGQFLNLESLSTLDETLLQYIANETKGEYFPIKNEQSFSDGFSQVMQTSPSMIKHHLDIYFALAGLLLLIIEWILSSTRFNTIP